ncbi:MAG: type III PLP-dependent enzyme, partial [Candidatus Omnitrophica bacterium]|nr:type III PLP-dependent enzyme [Candidatus Omnitrophota bacterium]
MKRSEFSPNGSAVENLIRQMLKKHPSPVMILRRSGLKKQFERFRDHLPKVTPYYAVKANPHPEVIKTFLKLGANFDVASAAEMNLALNLGATPQRIIFANTIKSIEDIQMAARRRVTLMTFDNEPELYKIAKHAPGARVIVRIKVENVGSVVELSLKFGADPEQAVFLLRKAKALGLWPEGVSFHVGSQCANVENYVHALEIAAGIFKEAKQEGLTLSTLDIGGGFPIRHTDHEKNTVFETMARTIRAEMARLFDKKTKFIAEPGRFLVGPAGILVTQVIGRT